jgi:hypothetical protein
MDLDTYGGYSEELALTDLAELEAQHEALERDPDPPGCGCETWNCTVCQPPWGSAGEVI